MTSLVDGSQCCYSRCQHADKPIMLRYRCSTCLNHVHPSFLHNSCSISVDDEGKVQCRDCTSLMLASMPQPEATQEEEEKEEEESPTRASAEKESPPPPVRAKGRPKRQKQPKEPSNNENKSNKRLKRKQYTIDDKSKVIEALEEGETTESISKRLGIPASTIRNWKNEAERARIEYARDVGKGECTKVFLKHPTHRIHDAVKDFFSYNKTIEKDFQISFCGPTIRTEASYIKQALLTRDKAKPYLSDKERLGLEGFKACRQWSHRFAKDNRFLKCIAVDSKIRKEKGEKIADEQNVELDLINLIEVISQYPPDHVYNMAETGLFYKVLPNKEYVHTDEDNDELIRGTKQMKPEDRVTLYLCTNESGTHKVPIFLVGKSGWPKCFGPESSQTRLPYYAQKKAWSDAKAFQMWFAYFCRDIRRKTNAKVLLILDPYGPHGAKVEDPTGQVKVAFLPLESTAKYQPMDAGVITALKRRYRFELIRNIMTNYYNVARLREQAKKNNMAEGTMGLEQGCMPHLDDAMRIIKKVWAEIPEVTLKICWSKCGLRLDSSNNNNTNPTIDTTAMEQDIVQENNNLFVQIATFLSHDDRANNAFEELDECVHEMRKTLLSLCHNNPKEAILKVIEDWTEMESLDDVKEFCRKEVQELMRDEILNRIVIEFGGTDEPNEEEENDRDETIVQPLSEEEFSTAIDNLQLLASRLREQNDRDAEALAKLCLDLNGSINEYKRRIRSKNVHVERI